LNSIGWNKLKVLKIKSVNVALSKLIQSPPTHQKDKPMQMMEEAKIKKKRAPTALLITCSVCGAPAPDHLHFGGHCCYSCRAFFRRTIERMEKIDIVCRTGVKDCEVSEMSKSCSACRYQKCLSVGMSTHLLQGKRKKKANELDDPPYKSQKVFEEIPQLEMTPRYKNIVENQRFLKELNPMDYTKSSVKISTGHSIHDHMNRKSYQESFHHENEEFGMKDDTMFVNPVSSSFQFRPIRQSMPGLDLGRRNTNTTFQEENRTMSDEFLDHNRNFSKNNGDFGCDIQDPYLNSESKCYELKHKETSQQLALPLVIPLVMSQPSVIQEKYRTNVIQSARTSVIQHGQGQPSPPPPNKTIEVDQVERWKNPEVAPSKSSLQLRYEAHIMKYQADLLKQRSEVLDCKAKLMEQQETVRKLLVSPFLPKKDSTLLPNPGDWNRKEPDSTQNIDRSKQKSDNQQIFSPWKAQQSNSPHMSVKPMFKLQDTLDNMIIKNELTEDEPPITEDILQQKKAEVPLVGVEHDQQVYLHADIKHLFSELLEEANSNPTFELTRFQSKVFLEANDLLKNSPLQTLFNTMIEGKEKDGIKQSYISKVFKRNGQLEVKIEKVIDKEDTTIKELKSVALLKNAPEFRFTSEEMDWVDKIQQTMAICTKSMIREQTYQAVIDNWRGEITHSDLLGVLEEGKARQAYMHILIMSNLPYFRDLTSRAQRWLMKSAAAVGMELMMAVFFFAHSSQTTIGQAETCGLATNFKKYIETKAPYAVKMPAVSYESLYKSPWAETIDDEIRHRRGQQLVGESLKGKDPRIMPLLYALSFYAVSEPDMAEMNLSETDYETIKKAQEHLGIIYRRFLKQHHGWKAAAGYALSHIYYLSVLKENVTIGFPTLEK